MATNTNIISELATLKEQVRLKNEQNDKDHTEIKGQLRQLISRVDTVIGDHEKRLKDVEEIITPIVGFRDELFKKVVQFTLLGGLAALAIYVIVSRQ